MCGRTACALDKEAICKRCQLMASGKRSLISPRWKETVSYVPSYNIAPGSFTPIFTFNQNDDDEAVIQPMRWGLVPSFIKADSKKSYATSNARIESLLEKPFYSNSMRLGMRCVVLAEGFYEWKSSGGRKQPYYIFPSDRKRLLMMAGIYAFNDSLQLFSYSVITTSAKGMMSTLHHRMPVILSGDEQIFTWLDASGLDCAKAYTFLLEQASNLSSCPLDVHPVSSRVNSTKYNCLDCTIPVDLEEEKKNASKNLGSVSAMSAFLKRPMKQELNDETVIEQKILKSDDEIKKDGVREEKTNTKPEPGE